MRFCNSAKSLGPLFNITMLSYWYRKSHCLISTMAGVSFAGKMRNFYTEFWFWLFDCWDVCEGHTNSLVICCSSVLYHIVFCLFFRGDFWILVHFPFCLQFSSERAVMVIATTNSPDDLDPALRRPGRLDREIEVGVPSAKERADVSVSDLRGLIKIAGILLTNPHAFCWWNV